jgi:hypothetical protein
MNVFGVVVNKPKNVAAAAMKIIPFKAAAALNGSHRLMRINGTNPTRTVDKKAEENFRITNRRLTPGALKINREVFLNRSLVEMGAIRGTRMKKMMGIIVVRIVSTGAARLKKNEIAMTMKKIG